MRDISAHAPKINHLESGHANNFKVLLLVHLTDSLIVTIIRVDKMRCGLSRMTYS